MLNPPAATAAAAHFGQHFSVLGIVDSALKVTNVLCYMAPEYITAEKLTKRSYGYAFRIIVVQILLGLEFTITLVQATLQSPMSPGDSWKR
nr:probable leucine-rich repeat receptor-like protein kinase At5g63930 [Tanacetum cinerariifolium]